MKIKPIFAIILSLFIVSVFFAAAGDADLSFNSTGSNVLVTGDGDEEIRATAIQSDGKIIAVGKAGANFGLARYTTAGVLDTTFGSGGKTYTLFSHGEYVAMAVRVLPDGKILVAGPVTSTAYSLALARYNSNGTLDATFGSGGTMVTSIPVSPGIVSVAAVEITSDRIVVAGRCRPVVGDGGFCAARFMHNGLADTAFGSGGAFYLPPPGPAGSNDYLNGMTIQPDGKILLIGYRNIGSTEDIMVARLNTNGTLDTSFESDGLVIKSILTGYDRGTSAAVQSDGRIVVAGYGGSSTNTNFAFFRLNANGTTDTSFGFGGSGAIDIGGYVDLPHAIKLQADGKIILAGLSYTNGDGQDRNFALIRLTASGGLDSTYGSGGKVTTSFTYPLASRSEINTLSIQSDGRALAFGMSHSGNSDPNFTITRYNTNGTLDSAFGSSGKVVTKKIIGSATFDTIKMQPDGKIVAAGWVSAESGTDPLVARFTASGALDATFGVGGIVNAPATDSQDSVRDVAIASDGKIFAAGESPVSGNLWVARYTSTGALDTTFGSGGKAVLTLLPPYFMLYAEAVAVQADGKVVLGGIGSTQDFYLCRFNANGTQDFGFGSDGLVRIDFSYPEQLRDILIQPDGKILVGGYRNEVFGVVRLTTTGALDSSFGTGGIATLDFSPYRDVLTSMALQSDNKIVVAGYAPLTPTNDTFKFAVARLNTNGGLDPTFSSNGKVDTDLSGVSDIPYNVAIQSDGKILVQGVSDDGVDPGHTNIALVRYTSNGSLDTTFSGDGIHTFTVGTKHDQAYGMVLQSDNRIVISGDTNGARYNEGLPFITRRKSDSTPFAMEEELATLSGRITTADGTPVKNLTVSLSGGWSKTVLTTTTNEFGYYQFDQIPVNQLYHISVNAKRHSFAEPFATIDLKGNTSGQDFVANTR